MIKKNQISSDHRVRLLHASLVHVPSIGWNMESFRVGAKDIGLQPIDAERVFPGGASEAASFYSEQLDQAMLETLSTRDLDTVRIRDRVALGVRTRIEAAQANREAIKRLLSYLILPGKKFLAAQLTWKTCDAIWFVAGDTATDFNYYTKRTLLLPVFTSTLLFWLKDDSVGFKKSWEFLDRRIENILKIPKISGKIRKVLCGFIPNGRGAQRS